MKRYSTPTARVMLRRALEQLEPPAIDYIDWQTFEMELEKVFAVTDVSKARVAEVFGKACTRARHRYHQAVADGTAWKQ